MAANATLPEWFDPIEAVISYTFMIASFFTVLLYFMEILILCTLRKSTYKGMFYQIFTIGITVDVISLMNNYLGCVFPAKGWFGVVYLSMGTLVGKLYLMIAWSARCIQGCTVVALALNRATAVCLPIKHKQIWNNKYISLIHIFQLGIGFCIGSCLIPQKFYWKYERNGFYVQFYNKEFRGRFFMAAYVLETIFVALIMIINLTMVIAFRTKYRMRMASQTQLNQKVMNEKQRQEYNLTIVAVLTCVAEIVYYLYVIYVFGINTSVPTRVFYLLYDVINDLYCGLSGWLLLIYSRSMRTHVTRMIKCPMLGIRRIRVLIPAEQQFSSATNLEGNKNTSNRRVTTCGTPC